MPPLLPYPLPCVTGNFLRRHKRFSVAILLNGVETWIHSNNSGAMLGLLRPGAPVLASPAANPARKLRFTQEAVWLADAPGRNSPPQEGAGFWVGVNTAVPNRMLEAAFRTGRLDFARGYAHLIREAPHGQSRLDACCTGDGLPPLWIECKNVTMMEDGMACFPDAATERGRKHLHELMRIVAQGGRAAMFYLVQRPDGRCFGPAACVDPEYAALFAQAVRAGVEMYPYRAHVSPQGIDLGERLPLAPLA